MNMRFLHVLAHAIFRGDPAWAWRRRLTLSGGLMFLAGMANSIWFDADLAHASMVMPNCVTGFLGIFGAYAAAVVTDDHLKRNAGARSTQPRGDNPDGD